MPSTAPPLRAEFSLCVSIPSLADLRAAVVADDWATVEAYFDFLDHEDDRAIASSVVTDLSTAERFLEQVGPRPRPAAVRSAGPGPC